MSTLQNFLEYAADIEQVDPTLPEKVTPPSVPKGEDVNFERLEIDDARRLLVHFRSIPRDRYSREHVLLELEWFTGARSGGLRAVDLEDYDSAAQVIDFVHRSHKETPLKNGVDGQRSVGLNDDVCDAIDGYIQEMRPREFDEQGHEPLLATTEGRMSANAVRAHTYLATIPCLFTTCPHGNDSAICEYIHYEHASKRPSSLSPHRVRTGSII